MDEPLKVLLVAAESAPFAKVGGLAEFTGALAKALRTLGVDARVMIPRYGDRERSAAAEAGGAGQNRALSSGSQKRTAFQRIGASIPVSVGSESEPAQLFSTEANGVPVYLVYNDQHFGNRERVYGFNDDPQRFMFFSRAVLAAVKVLDWIPDVVHTNDWHTAPVTAWLDFYGRREGSYRSIASLFTVHDLAYQGVCGRLLLSYGQMTALPHLTVEPPGKVNWMAQGIAHADLVSTVSPTHARELLDTEFAGDLKPLLEGRQDRVVGILSGIDTEVWDPRCDDTLSQSYDVSSLRMRAVNKTSLQRELRLPTDLDVPLVGVVARLDPLKGFDLLFGAMDQLFASRDLQFVVLGTGDEKLAQRSQALQDRYPGNVRALIRFDERLARRIYAGVDLFVMPSQYESVSVGVMTAMRYGAVPLVRAVGGLADTVIDADLQPDAGNGFSFVDFSETAIGEAFTRALHAYDDEARWVMLQTRAMERDFSWNASARAYIDLYNRALQLHSRRQ
ncbi:MAG: glycogen synthase [Anaerolineae bacterium]|nr:glycogen synthase [Anaerolineae bacterium]